MADSLDGYNVPASTSKTGYFKPSQEGKYRLRILSDQPVVGFEWWTGEEGDRTPHRVRTLEEVPVEFLNTGNWRKEAKHFKVLLIWNYKDELVQIWSITQGSIQRKLQELASTGEWGNPNGYDITLTRDDSGDFVKYDILPSPKSELDPKIKEAVKSQDIDLDKLFEGSDPFDDPGAELRAMEEPTKVQEEQSIDLDDLDNIIK